MNPDFVDLLRAFLAADVRFLVVGAYALALHGRPRATGDLDLWVDATPENAARIMSALTCSGAPIEDVSESDFAGITFAEAWTDRTRHPFGDVEVDFIGRLSLIRNKRATGRPQDLVDIDGME
jgi:hypothetical protein